VALFVDGDKQAWDLTTLSWNEGEDEKEVVLHWKAEEGVHNLSLVVDQLNLIAEADESNNNYSISVDVEAAVSVSFDRMVAAAGGGGFMLLLAIILWIMRRRPGAQFTTYYDTTDSSTTYSETFTTELTQTEVSQTGYDSSQTEGDLFTPPGQATNFDEAMQSNKGPGASNGWMQLR